MKINGNGGLLALLQLVQTPPLPQSKVHASSNSLFFLGHFCKLHVSFLSNIARSSPLCPLKVNLFVSKLLNWCFLVCVWSIYIIPLNYLLIAWLLLLFLFTYTRSADALRIF